MATQYLRQVSLYVGGSSQQNATLLVEDLRVDFTIEKTISSEPNTAKIQVYNLAREKRFRVAEEFTRVVLVAGFDGEQAEIFVGNIRNVTHTKTQAGDIITRIDAGDGDEAIRKSITVKSFAPNIDTKSLVTSLVSDMKTTAKGYIDDLLGNDKPVTSPRGLVVNGSTANELDFFAKEAKFNWSIQNGTIDAVNKTGYIDDVVYISPESGMIGSPEAIEIGVKVKCLINPRIAPNRIIVIHSPFFKETIGDTDAGGGVYRVKRVTFSGSNSAKVNDFYCSIEAQRLENGKIL